MSNSNIERSCEKVGEVVGYGAAAGVKAIGVGLASLGRGLKKGATEGMAASPNLPTGPLSAAGAAVGNALGALRRGYRDARENVRRRNYDARHGSPEVNDQLRDLAAEFRAVRFLELDPDM